MLHICFFLLFSGMTIRDEAVDWREEMFRQVGIFRKRYFSASFMFLYISVIHCTGKLSS
jgi:hypothetical protein